MLSAPGLLGEGRQVSSIRLEIRLGQFDKTRKTKRLKLDLHEQPSSEHYSGPFCRSGIGRPTESPIMPNQALEGAHGS